MTQLTVTTPRRTLYVPLRDVHFEFARSSGPGGQNVNKVNSKVVLRWNVARNRSLPEDVRERLRTRYAGRITRAGDILVSSQRYRDQGRNLADCLEKLKALLEAVAEPPKSRRPTRPTAGSQHRRLATKLARSRIKQQRRSPRSEDG